MKRIITVNEYGKVISIEYTADESFELTSNQFICDIAKIGQLRTQDGNYENDPKAEIVNKFGRAFRNKKEAYEEFIEAEKMLGVDSAEAVAAKEAYLRISTTNPDKSRYELEQEVKTTPSKINEAKDELMLELIEGGLI